MTMTTILCGDCDCAFGSAERLSATETTGGPAFFTPRNERFMRTKRLSDEQRVRLGRNAKNLFTYLWYCTAVSDRDFRFPFVA